MNVSQGLNLITIWVRKNLILIGVTAFIVAYGILGYIPPHYNWFEVQRNILAAGILLLGAAAILIGLINQITLPTALINIIIPFLYLIFTGLITGKIIQTLWQNGRSGRIILVIILILNTCLGLFVLAWGNVLVTRDPSLDCQKFITQNQGLKIVTYSQFRILPGAYHFYLFTLDGGKTWTQLFSDSSDEITAGDCQTFQTLNSDFLWVWSPYHLETTHDGGSSWTHWAWECCKYGAIKHVNYQDEMTGRMTLFPWGDDITNLFTTDGGKTWLPEK